MASPNRITECSHVTTTDNTDNLLVASVRHARPEGYTLAEPPLPIRYETPEETTYAGQPSMALIRVLQNKCWDEFKVLLIRFEYPFHIHTPESELTLSIRNFLSSKKMTVFRLAQEAQSAQLRKLCDQIYTDLVQCREHLS